MLLGFDEDLYVGGRPIKRLNEETLDKIIEQAIETQRPDLQERQSFTIPTKSSINLVNIRPPVLTTAGVSSEQSTNAGLDSLGHLNREVERLGLENRQLRQAISEYVEREETLKEHVLANIDNCIKETQNSDAADQSFLADLRSEVNEYDDDRDGFVCPMNYGALIKFMGYLTEQSSRFSKANSPVVDQNQIAFSYQAPPQEQTFDDDLLIQLLKKNDEHQSQIQQLLRSRVGDYK